MWQQHTEEQVDFDTDKLIVPVLDPCPLCGPLCPLWDPWNRMQDRSMLSLSSGVIRVSTGTLLPSDIGTTFTSLFTLVTTTTGGVGGGCEI